MKAYIGCKTREKPMACPELPPSLGHRQQVQKKQSSVDKRQR